MHNAVPSVSPFCLGYELTHVKGMMIGHSSKTRMIRPLLLFIDQAICLAGYAEAGPYHFSSGDSAIRSLCKGMFLLLLPTEVNVMLIACFMRIANSTRTY